MRKIFFTLLISVTSTLLFAQEKNVLFTPYTIGDNINKHIERLFIYDSKHKEYLKADNLNAAQYVYFPKSEDSSVFSLMKFNVVLIRNNKSGEGLVSSIWLLDPISSDSSNNNVFNNYITIKNYLDEKLKVAPEEQKSNYYTLLINKSFTFV